MLLAEAAGIQADGALLMRPDGFVAWRAWESIDPETSFYDMPGADDVPLLRFTYIRSYSQPPIVIADPGRCHLPGSHFLLHANLIPSIQLFYYILGRSSDRGITKRLFRPIQNSSRNEQYALFTIPNLPNTTLDATPMLDAYISLQ